jgi:hypothetical protein
VSKIISQEATALAVLYRDVILVTLLAMFIGLVIFMIFALDPSVPGRSRRRPEPYQFIYDHLMKP